MIVMALDGDDGFEPLFDSQEGVLNAEELDETALRGFTAYSQDENEYQDDDEQDGVQLSYGQSYSGGASGIGGTGVVRRARRGMYAPGYTQFRPGMGWAWGRPKITRPRTSGSVVPFAGL